jgi:SpoVK/Ycf46/Vps4 family AAA+-type ATPase
MDLKITANVTQKQPSFGYNKRLNVQLKSLLAKQPNSEITTRLSHLNDFCNNLEKTITQKVKESAPEFELQALVNMLSSVKATFAEMIETTFPKLDYIQREISAYEKESLTYKFRWKSDIMLALDQKLIELYQTLKVVPDTILETTANASGGKQIKNIINEFQPTPESPKDFSSVGGMEALKRELYDKIIYPIRDPEGAKLDELEYGKKLPRATLFFGPPGNGKTFLAEAVAREADVPFFKLKASKAGSKYINETSKNYEKIFDAIEETSKNNNKPSILFIDEIDGLGRNRDGQSSEEDLKQIGTLLDLMNDARNKGIIIIGATNKHTLMDEAVKSRFDNQIFIGMPDKESRKAVLKKALEGKTKAEKLLASGDDLNVIADAFDGFSNRAIVDLSSHAANIARRNGRRDITQADYLEVISQLQSLKVNNGNAGYKVKAPQKMGFGK